MLVTLSSVRGSPGVTSWALLLGAAWPHDGDQERMVLEADCSGGVLGARYELGIDPGAVSLISASRHRDVTPNPADHGRRLADGFWVIPGPEVAEQAVPAWRSGASDVAATLARDRSVWLADLGRSGPDTPVRTLASAAALNLVVSGSAVEDIVQLPARLDSLSETAPSAVIIVGHCAYPEGELHRFLGGRALWVVPHVEGLPSLSMRAIRGGRARRSKLWRAAVEVAADVAAMSGRREAAAGHNADDGATSDGATGDRAASDRATGEAEAARAFGERTPPLPPAARRLASVAGPDPEVEAEVLDA